MLRDFFLFLRLLRCFTSAGLPHAASQRGNAMLSCVGFPHSEIPVSKVARHLPEAFRSHVTSFVALISLGIHHVPLIYATYHWLATNTHYSLHSMKLSKDSHEAIKNRSTEAVSFVHIQTPLVFNRLTVLIWSFYSSCVSYVT